MKDASIPTIKTISDVASNKIYLDFYPNDTFEKVQLYYQPEGGERTLASDF